MGGAWERLIGVIKRVLKTVVPHTINLTDEVLAMLFCEIEAIVNSRPLTKLSSDTKDFTPLTPNMLLTSNLYEVLPGNGTKSDVYRSR